MINIDALNDDEKLAALESIHKSIAQSKEIQKKKITTNVELIVKALKKIESDLQQRYDETGKLIANLKNGEDGRDGKDGKDGRDGKNGRDGAIGPRGFDGIAGRNGADGQDGVSVVDAQIDFDGSLTITLSNGNVINAGEIVNLDLAEKIKVITNGGGTSQFVLDALASLEAQISQITSGLEYQGTWNASTNTPTLASSVGTAGYYYIVATAGSTNLNGVTDWQIGDWAVFNGTVWQKIDQTNLVTSVAGRTGAIVLTTADIGGLGTIATQASSNVSITGGSITGITDLAIADGGTGQSTAAAAITALTGTQTTGYYLRSNGTNAALAAIVAGDIPTLNQNTTGNAANVTGTVAIANGGTGQTTANAAFNALVPSQTSNSGKYLTTNGSDTSWATNPLGTVTSVAASVPTFLSIAGSPITTSGTLAITLSGTALPVANGGTGITSFGTGVATFLGTPSSANLASAVTDETGSGSLVFATSPTLVTPLLGTPTSGNFSTGTFTWPTFNQNTTGTASNVTGTVAIANGGTGLTTTPANGALDIGNGTGFTRTTLTAGTGVSITNAAGSITINATGTGGTVTSVAATVPSFLSITGSPITTSGTLAFGLSGTALPTTSGGTGLTSFTANGVVYASSTSALATGSSLTFNGTRLTTYVTSDSNQNIARFGVQNTANTDDAFLDIYADAANNLVTLDSTGNNSGLLAFKLGGSEQMRLTSTGLGIGTTSPSYKLVSAVARGSVGWALYNTNAATYDGWISSTSDNGLAINARGQTAGNATGNTLYLQTGDTTRVTLDSSGNLGIGTSSPSTILVASLSSSSTGLAISTSLPTIALYDSNGTTGTTFWGQIDTNTYFYNKENGALIYGVNNAEAMRLTSTGLGIGTSSPGAKLDVNGSTRATGLTLTGSDILAGASQTTVDSLVGTASRILAWGPNTSTAGTLYLGTISSDASVGSTSAVVLNGSGNLGLGVTPSAWSGVTAFQSIYGILSGNSQVNITQNAYYNGGWKYTSTAAAALYFQGSGAHNWQIAPSGTAGNAITFTQAMTLDADGDLGIGTTSPSTRLHVAGASQLVRLQRDDAYIQFANTANTDTAYIQQTASVFNIISQVNGVMVFGTNSTERARIDSSGNLLIGATGSLTGSSRKTLLLNSAAGELSILEFGVNGTLTGYLYSNTSQTQLVAAGARPLIFETGNAERARIDSSGNLLVGTTSAPNTNAKVRSSTGIQYNNTVLFDVSSPNGKVFTVTGGSNGLSTFVEIEIMTYQGYFKAMHFCANSSGNWEIDTFNQVTAGTTPTVTVAGSGTATITLTVACTTSYSPIMRVSMGTSFVSMA